MNEANKTTNVNGAVKCNVIIWKEKTAMKSYKDFIYEIIQGEYKW